MSFRSFQRSCRPHLPKPKPFNAGRCSSQTTKVRPERVTASGNRFARYTLGAVMTSTVGLWAWAWIASENLHQAGRRPLSPDYFTPTKLTSSEKTSDDTKLLRLSILPDVIARLPKPTFQPIWSIYVKDSDIQVERAYTPLEGISSTGEMIFWIKKYEHGEVGRWLHRRTPGEEIEIRGPERTWEWQDGAWDHVIMIAGGTGITPFYQLLHSLFSDPTKTATNSRFTLLQSYHSPQEIPPPIILKNLSKWESSNPQKLQLRTFLDNLDGQPEKDNVILGRVNKSALKTALKAVTGRTIVLVCGPEPMINALAGPKGRNDSQGAVGGALGTLNDGTFHVWKL